MTMRWNTTGVAGSQWAQTFAFDVDITGLVWRFVIRPSVTDDSQPPLVKVTATATGQGQITVDTVARTVQVVLTPAATTLLGRGSRALALHSNADTTTSNCWIEGAFNSSLVAAP